MARPIRRCSAAACSGNPASLTLWTIAWATWLRRSSVISPTLSETTSCCSTAGSSGTSGAISRARWAQDWARSSIP